VGQGFARLGTSDPRLTSSGSIDFRLQRQLRGYTRADPPPDRVKPIPISVIIHAANAAAIVGTADHIAVANMLTIAFFFLMRPGEYTNTPSDTTPFTLADVQLFIGRRRLNIFLDSEAALLTSTFCLYTFTLFGVSTTTTSLRGPKICRGVRLLNKSVTAPLSLNPTP
jgi:hypothetical protein